MYSAVAGVLYAHMINYISPDTFTAYDSSLILWIVIVGGLGHLPAPILGAIVMSILPEALRGLGNWRLVIYGVTLILVIMYYPGGMAKYLNRLYAFAKRKKSERAK